jgi:hypothetical protein
MDDRGLFFFIFIIFGKKPNQLCHKGSIHSSSIFRKDEQHDPQLRGGFSFSLFLRKKPELQALDAET